MSISNISHTTNSGNSNVARAHSDNGGIFSGAANLLSGLDKLLGGSENNKGISNSGSVANLDRSGVAKQNSASTCDEQRMACLRAVYGIGNTNALC